MPCHFYPCHVECWLEGVQDCPKPGTSGQSPYTTAIALNMEFVSPECKMTVLCGSHYCNGLTQLEPKIFSGRYSLYKNSLDEISQGWVSVFPFKAKTNVLSPEVEANKLYQQKQEKHTQQKQYNKNRFRTLGVRLGRPGFKGLKGLKIYHR